MNSNSTFNSSGPGVARHPLSGEILNAIKQAVADANLRIEVDSGSAQFPEQDVFYFFAENGDRLDVIVVTDFGGAKVLCLSDGDVFAMMARDSFNLLDTAMTEAIDSVKPVPKS